MSTIMEYFTGNAVPDSSYGDMGKTHHRLKKVDDNNSSPAQRRGLNFGIAAKSGRGIRRGLKEILPNPADRNMQGRLQGAIANWLGVCDVSEITACDETPFVNDFQFIKGQDFVEKFKIPVTITHPQQNLIVVSLDAFIPRAAIISPPGTVSVELVLTVAGCMLQGGTPTGNKTINIIIPYNKLTQPAQVIKFPIHMPAGSLTVTAARLMYRGKEDGLLKKIDHPTFAAAGVLNARYSF